MRLSKEFLLTAIEDLATLSKTRISLFFAKNSKILITISVTFYRVETSCLFLSTKGVRLLIMIPQYEVLNVPLNVHY